MEQVDTYLERAEQSIQRTKDLTQQLLTFAKGGEPLKTTVDIVELVRETAEFAVRGSNVSLAFDCDVDVRRVFVDEGQLTQVISNLVINADQAMPAGGTISIAVKNLDHYFDLETRLTNKWQVRIIISDQGSGIDPEYREKIFDPYFTTKSTGSGLGLSLCYSIIKKHQGSIQVESEIGRGATFTIDLPAIDELERGNSQKKVDHVVRKNEGSAVSLKILLLDDELVLREIMAEMFSLLGHSVVTVADGREAIKLYSEVFNTEQAFDLVIADLTIPGGMGGLETFEILHALDPMIKVIVSSGYSNDPVMANYADYGFVGVISKPYTLSEIEKILAELAIGKVG